MLDRVTELCFVAVLMKIYIFLSSPGSYGYAKSWLYWHVGDTTRTSLDSSVSDLLQNAAIIT